MHAPSMPPLRPCDWRLLTFIAMNQCRSQVWSWGAGIGGVIAAMGRHCGTTPAMPRRCKMLLMTSFIGLGRELTPGLAEKRNHAPSPLHIASSLRSSDVLDHNECTLVL